MIAGAKLILQASGTQRTEDQADTWTSLGTLAAMIAAGAERGATGLALASRGQVAGEERRGEPRLSRELTGGRGGNCAGFVKGRHHVGAGQHRPNVVPFAPTGSRVGAGRMVIRS